MVICTMFLHDTHRKTVSFLVMPALHVLQLIVRTIAVFDFNLLLCLLSFSIDFSVEAFSCYFATTRGLLGS